MLVPLSVASSHPLIFPTRDGRRARRPFKLPIPCLLDLAPPLLGPHCACASPRSAGVGQDPVPCNFQVSCKLRPGGPCRWPVALGLRRPSGAKAATYTPVRNHSTPGFLQQEVWAAAATTEPRVRRSRSRVRLLRLGRGVRVHQDPVLRDQSRWAWAQPSSGNGRTNPRFSSSGDPPPPGTRSLGDLGLSFHPQGRQDGVLDDLSPSGVSTDTFRSLLPRTCVNLPLGWRLGTSRGKGDFLNFLGPPPPSTHGPG